MIQIQGFRYDFNVPIVTAHQQIAQREGFVLSTEVLGQVIQGECCPLPGFSRESLADCRRLAESWTKHSGPIDDSWLRDCANDASALPSLRSAVETLRIQLAAVEGRTLSEWPVANWTKVRAHALVWDEESALKALADGFSTLKIKVGATSIREDMLRIRAIRRAVGDAPRLRLDANRAWTEDNARIAIDAFQTERIEFIEEPLASGGASALATLRGYSTIPIAADELARDEASIQELLQQQSADLIVLKPALCGGPISTLKLANLCAKKGVRVVITTTFDGPVGTAMTLEVCARLPGIEIAHGVATGRLFKQSDEFPTPKLGYFKLEERA